MCKIKLNNVAKVFDDATITKREGRYKKTSASEWINFDIPSVNGIFETPDIQEDGEFEVQIRVKDSLNTWSAWSNSVNFTVGVDCEESGDTAAPIVVINAPEYPAGGGSKTVTTQVTDEDTNLDYTWTSTCATFNNSKVKNPVVTITNSSTTSNKSCTIQLKVCDSSDNCTIVQKVIVVPPRTEISTSPQWVSTGVTNCSTSSSTNTGHGGSFAFRKEKDSNPNSSSYNETRWVRTPQEDYLCNSSDTNPNWQDTGETVCGGEDENGDYTPTLCGDIEFKIQKDVNSNSGTYNNTRSVKTGEFCTDSEACERFTFKSEDDTSINNKKEITLNFDTNNSTKTIKVNAVIRKGEEIEPIIVSSPEWATSVRIEKGSNSEGVYDLIISLPKNDSSTSKNGTIVLNPACTVVGLCQLTCNITQEGKKEAPVVDRIEAECKDPEKTGEYTEVLLTAYVTGTIDNVSPSTWNEKEEGVYTKTATGNNTHTITVTNEGGSDSKSYTISCIGQDSGNYPDLVIGDIVGTDENPTVNPTGGDGTYTYLWEVVSGCYVIDNPTTKNPTIRCAEGQECNSGVIKVTVTSGGETKNATKTVNIVCETVNDFLPYFDNIVITQDGQVVDADLIAPVGTTVKFMATRQQNDYVNYSCVIQGSSNSTIDVYNTEYTLNVTKENTPVSLKAIASEGADDYIDAGQGISIQLVITSQSGSPSSLMAVYNPR